MERLLNRIKTRLADPAASDDLLAELLIGSIDCLLLYVQEEEIPGRLETVAVMMTIDAYNRLGTEGVKSENKGSLSQSFYDDSLDPYRSVLDKYVEKQRAKKRVLWV